MAARKAPKSWQPDTARSAHEEHPVRLTSRVRHEAERGASTTGSARHAHDCGVAFNVATQVPGRLGEGLRPSLGAPAGRLGPGRGSGAPRGEARRSWMSTGTQTSGARMSLSIWTGEISLENGDMEVERSSLTTNYRNGVETDSSPIPVVKRYLKRPRAHASYSVETLLIGLWSDLRKGSRSCDYEHPDTGDGLTASIGDSPLNGAESRGRWRRDPVGATAHRNKRGQGGHECQTQNANEHDYTTPPRARETFGGDDRQSLKTAFRGDSAGRWRAYLG